MDPGHQPVILGLVPAGGGHARAQAGSSVTPRCRAVAEACRAHGKVLGVGGIRHNVGLQGELIRLGARFVIAGTDVNYVLAGARQDTAALRAIPLG